MKYSKERRNEDENEAKLSKWDFFKSGPFHLTRVDWNNADHRRSVYASLTQGVYIMERDREQNRMGSNAGAALAPPWWEFFNFHCIRILVDQIDFSIFGAVFEQKHQHQHLGLHAPSPYSAYYYHQHQHQHQHQGVRVPCSRYIVVFRGTMFEEATIKRDLYLDFQFIMNKLPYDSARYQIAFHEIHNILVSVGPRNVVLVGHSLGAAIAVEAGKYLAKIGCHIETYLFNPPSTSIPVEAISDGHSSVKEILRVATTILNTLAMPPRPPNNIMTQQQQHGQFLWFASWVPNVFVNPKDLVCCKYIGCFEHRNRTEVLGLNKVGHHHTAAYTTPSLRSLLTESDDEPPHMLLSAFLTKNMTPKEQSRKEAHCIEQWWQPHSNWHSKLYLYNNNG